MRLSELRPVTPLLSEHIMGEAISDHHGVRCCPALHTQTEEKYIVKIVSVPASKGQLDALLLSGAYASAEEARLYFHTLAQETVAEAELLQKLSRLEGFYAHEGWQIQEMEDGSGYEVWLLSRYGNTLERMTRRGCLTHLQAVNLGLDLCAALSVSRRNGWLYVDLKPENIFESPRGYLIGDLGFISLKSLKYASLPEKYRSAYTAPEVADAFATLSPTMDIYAAGLVLYGVFNEGLLPQPGQTPDAPVHADGDMAQIILKACDPDPAQRWQDPQEMGQALALYLQSHSVNDTPIVPMPEPEPEPEPEPVPEPEKEEECETVPVELASENSEDTDLNTSLVEDDGAVEQDDEIPSELNEEVEEECDNSSETDTEVGRECDQSAETDEVVEGTAISEDSEPDTEQPEKSVADTEAPQQSSAEEDLPEEEPEQFVIDGFLIDDALQDADAVAQLSDDVISDEVSQMLAQADELLAHKTPDPVVAPEAIEVPMPEPIQPEPEPEPEPEAEPEEPTDEEDPAQDAPEEEPTPEEPEEIYVPYVRKSRRKVNLVAVIGVLALILVLLIAGVGGKYYYDNIYLQSVSNITLEGAEDRLTVTLDTAIDNSLLTVTCTDTYGNRLTKAVVNNQAQFTGLSSGTAYRIQVVISGRHQLTGMTTTTYTTDTQTVIVGLSAVAGDTDGSVRLNFSVQGPDSEAGWLVKYSAPGMDELSAACSGHSVLIAGLEVGKTYTFRLEPMEELYLTGETEIAFTAAAVVLPQNLTIRGFENGALIADWGIADGLSAGSWTVRCYNSDGYDMTYTVTEPRIAIEGLDISKGYTLDVRAEGMTVGNYVSISAGSVTFKELLVDNTDPTKLVISWPYEGTAPDGGWTLVYTIDDAAPVEVFCEKSTCTLELPVPGATYRFQVVLPEEISHFGGTGEYTVADAPVHPDADRFTMGLFAWPELDTWTPGELRPEDMTETFAPGQKAGLLLRVEQLPEELAQTAVVTWILRTSEGKFLQILQSEVAWKDAWVENACALALPELPGALGEYTLELLLDGSRLGSDPICVTVAEPVVEEPTEPTEPEEPAEE